MCYTLGMGLWILIIFSLFLSEAHGQTSEAVVPPAPPAAQISIPKDQPVAQQPFWKSKPEVRKKILEERAVVVSVASEKLVDDETLLLMKGAGVVNAPRGFCFATAQRYERLKDVSDNFKDVRYDEAKQELFLTVQALGYQARIVMHIIPVASSWRDELQWEVTWGEFKGMKGIIGFEDSSALRTEMSMNVRFQSAHMPLPKILMGFAMEVVTQKVAERMRSWIESEYHAKALEANAKSK
jgi:hypothetical protein